MVSVHFSFVLEKAKLQAKNASGTGTSVASDKRQSKKNKIMIVITGIAIPLVDQGCGVLQIVQFAPHLH
jgi:hypothetical protein